VILLDTHIWVWWVASPHRLQAKNRDLLEHGADRVFGVSIISCWEVAKLVEYGRLKLDRDAGLWIESALAAPGVSLLHLNPQIVTNPSGCRWSAQLQVPRTGVPEAERKGSNQGSSNSFGSGSCLPHILLREAQSTRSHAPRQAQMPMTRRFVRSGVTRRARHSIFAILSLTNIPTGVYYQREEKGRPIGTCHS
jgi:hypothetical protein